VVLATHDAAVAERATRVIEIRDGQVVAEAAP
jgi:ABC-type lipoprotein export system ATPase subunit